MSNIRSRPLASPHTIDWIALGLALFGFIVSGYVWVIGARYTIDGIIWLLNWLLQFLPLNLTVRVPTGWPYLTLLTLPLLFSLVEVFKRPVRRGSDGARHLRSAGVIAVWIIIFTFDLLTTFLGLYTTDTITLTVLRQLMQSAAGAMLLTAILTLFPEWLFGTMIQVVKHTVRGETI